MACNHLYRHLARAALEGGDLDPVAFASTGGPLLGHYLFQCHDMVVFCSSTRTVSCVVEVIRQCLTN